MSNIDIVLFDTWLILEVNDPAEEDIILLNKKEFEKVCHILLTSNQYFQFSKARREFTTSKKRLAKAKKYINSKNNIWRINYNG